MSIVDMTHPPHSWWLISPYKRRVKYHDTKKEQTE